MEDKIIIKKYINYNNENSLDESARIDLYSSIDADFEVGPIKKNKHWNSYISSRKFLRVHKR